LTTLFEAEWRHASPVGQLATNGQRRSPLRPADQDLLTMLAAGLKDDAIAHQLGVSRRTVQRRISSLLPILNAANRTQIVPQAIRQGLLG
jgi:DNA-binding NarL/FixJ family response regulator